MGFLSLITRETVESGAPGSQAENETTIPLDRAPAASRVRVLEIAGGHGATRMLAQLDIRVGKTLRVHRSAPLGGPVLVETSGSTVAVGRSLARKVIVRVIT